MHKGIRAIGLIVFITLLLGISFGSSVGHQGYQALLVFNKDTELIGILEYDYVPDNGDLNIIDTIGGDKVIVQKSAEDKIDIIDLSQYIGNETDVVEKQLQIPAGIQDTDILGVYDNKLLVTDRSFMTSDENLPGMIINIDLIDPTGNLTINSLNLNFTKIIHQEDPVNNSMILVGIDYTDDILLFVLYEGTDEKLDRGDLIIHLYKTKIDGTDNSSHTIIIEDGPSLHTLDNIPRYAIIDLKNSGDMCAIMLDEYTSPETYGGFILYDFDTNEIVQIPFHLESNGGNEIEYLAFNQDKLYFSQAIGNPELFSNYTSYFTEYDTVSKLYTLTETVDISSFADHTIITDNFIVMVSYDERNYYIQSHTTIPFDDILIFARNLLIILAILVLIIVIVIKKKPIKSKK